MPVLISDETLREAGLTEREAVVEFACRLYDAGKLPLWPAAKLAGMSRSEFEQELINRKIPVYRPSLQDLADEADALDRLRERRRCSSSFISRPRSVPRCSVWPARRPDSTPIPCRRPEPVVHLLLDRPEEPGGLGLLTQISGLRHPDVERCAEADQGLMVLGPV